MDETDQAPKMLMDQSSNKLILYVLLLYFDTKNNKKAIFINIIDEEFILLLSVNADNLKQFDFDIAFEYLKSSSTNIIRLPVRYHRIIKNTNLV